jgi:hypothetical protein
MIRRFSTPTLGVALLLALGAVGCGGDGGPAPLGADAQPALGAQIDRAGRPAISTALVATFASTLPERNEARDRYNQALPATWPSFEPEVTTSLGILDALNGVCGDQLLAEDSGADRYDALADILLDDRLYVNTASGTCGVYLGLEGEVVGAVPAGMGGCGGRTPNDDVVERSFSVLAAGTLTGIDDLVTGDAGDHSAEVFPFLEGPN